MNKKHYSQLPAYIPQWIQKRVAVQVYKLYEFMAQAGQSTPASAYVLDAGAGEGRFKPEFAHTHYFGVDLAIGDDTWDYSNLDAISTLTSLPFADNTFDVALCNQVLEHVPEPYQVLAEIQRVLKPGGKLYFSAPQSWHQHQKPHDYYRYTSYGLTYLMQKAGFNIKVLEPLGGYFWFLSFQLHNINYWAFPKGMPGRIWTWPLRALFGLLFQLILPMILFYLDPLDRIKDETFGYVCVAEKNLGLYENSAPRI
jgi:SAM-dependent methyltransferase